MEAYQELGSGDRSNLQNIAVYDSSYNEGDKGLLQLNFSASIPDSVVSAIETEMINQGVDGARVNQNGNTVNIYFTQGMPALVVIVPILLALIVTLIIILVSWYIFKQVVPDGLQGPIGTALLVLLAIGGGYLVYKAIRR